jgi:2-(1,2-epoxy-1,2-dihydrophenyl)acetyl-CoA isomerase
MIEGAISIDTGTSDLLYSVRECVAVITLNRPEARNSLSDHLTPARRRMIKESGERPDVGALLITGAGTVFCSGGDVKGTGYNSAVPALSFGEKVVRLQQRQRTLTGAPVSVRKPAVAGCRSQRSTSGLAVTKPAAADRIRAAGLSIC